jgi:N-acetyl-alpha-D-glucosaminyl L-malate synthase BshA
VREAVIIVAFPTYGGSGIVASELGIALARRGWEVHFISSAMPVRLEMHNYGVQLEGQVFFHEVSGPAYSMFDQQPYALTLAAKIADTARERDIHLVHAHYAVPHTIAAHLASDMLGGKLSVITTLHGTDITIVGLDPSYRSVVCFALQASRIVTAVSQSLKHSTCKVFSPCQDIEVIHNFVAPEVFHPDQPDAASIRSRFTTNGGAMLIHVSNYRPVKRAPAVVEVFARVREKMQARLVMIGNGPDRSQAEERASSLGVAQDVTFLDNTLMLPPYLAAADLMIMPSSSESFGLAALEAMACGTPVIASNIGGLPEVISEGVDGVLRPPDDISGMAEAALALLRNPAALKAMSAAAADKPLTKFSRDKQVEKYAQAYRRVLAG